MVKCQCRCLEWHLALKLPSDLKCVVGGEAHATATFKIAATLPTLTGVVSMP
jgi:hypothetical protein